MEEAYYKQYTTNLIRGCISSGVFATCMFLLCLAHRFRWKEPRELSIFEYDLAEANQKDTNVVESPRYSELSDSAPPTHQSTSLSIPKIVVEECSTSEGKAEACTAPFGIDEVDTKNRANEDDKSTTGDEEPPTVVVEVCIESSDSNKEENEEADKGEKDEADKADTEDGNDEEEEDTAEESESESETSQEETADATEAKESTEKDPKAKGIDNPAFEESASSTPL